MTTQTQTQTIEINSPREGTKQAKLVAMLSRKSGVTLTKASEALGWLPHTTSATMTGLRKRGYAIVRSERPNKDSVYAIRVDEAEA
jgi:DNA-binding MarR family transcriptional regulator